VGFTGHCAYSYDCDRWKIGCGKCPYPKLHQVLKGWHPLGVEAENWAYSNSNLAVATQVNGWLSRLSKVCSTVSQFIISPTASILKPASRF